MTVHWITTYYFEYNRILGRTVDLPALYDDFYGSIGIQKARSAFLTRRSAIRNSSSPEVDHSNGTPGIPLKTTSAQLAGAGMEGATDWTRELPGENRAATLAAQQEAPRPPATASRTASQGRVGRGRHRRKRGRLRGTYRVPNAVRWRGGCGARWLRWRRSRVGLRAVMAAVFTRRTRR